MVLLSPSVSPSLCLRFPPISAVALCCVILAIVDDGTAKRKALLSLWLWLSVRSDSDDDEGEERFSNEREKGALPILSKEEEGSDIEKDNAGPTKNIRIHCTSMYKGTATSYNVGTRNESSQQKYIITLIIFALFPLC